MNYNQFIANQREEEEGRTLYEKINCPEYANQEDVLTERTGEEIGIEDVNDCE